MKHIILTHALNLTVAGFLLLPGCREERTFLENIPTEKARPDHERIVPEELPILCSETIIYAPPASRPVEEEPEWKCGAWQESRVGGAYRTCGWVLK